MKQRLLNILFWSVISAAFIGPGTITTAASAGAGFGYSLIWALLFSTFACILLQESSARLTTVSGLNLGQAIRQYLFHYFWGRMTTYLILTSIILGCVAYEAGNILGAVAGASLILDVPSYVLTVLIGLFAFTLFGFGSVNFIAKTMGVVVAFMGICFLTTAIVLQPPVGEIFAEGFIPGFPAGSEMLILALIGTTVVPYNLFLGSGIGSGQTLTEMRMSLGIAIGLGGVISIAVLIVGASIAGTFTFDALAEELTIVLGEWAALFLGMGLFAAGFSSAITAPLAAAITAKSLLQSKDADPEIWSHKGTRFKTVWSVVLLTGLLFGVMKIQPVPAIILAQALNGLILPLVSIFLFLMANNIQLLGNKAINGTLLNIFMGCVVFITVLIGSTNMIRAVTTALPVELTDENIILFSSLVLSLLIAWPVYRSAKKLRNANTPN